MVTAPQRKYTIAPVADESTLLTSNPHRRLGQIHQLLNNVSRDAVLERNALKVHTARLTQVKSELRTAKAAEDAAREKSLTRKQHELQRQVRERRGFLEYFDERYQELWDERWELENCPEGRWVKASPESPLTMPVPSSLLKRKADVLETEPTTISQDAAAKKRKILTPARIRSEVKLPPLSVSLPKTTTATTTIFKLKSSCQPMAPILTTLTPAKRPAEKIHQQVMGSRTQGEHIHRSMEIRLKQQAELTGERAKTLERLAELDAALKQNRSEVEQCRAKRRPTHRIRTSAGLPR